MRIVIVGGGTVGYALGAALAAHHDLFVIDPNAERADHLGQLDVEFVPGSGTDPEVLRRACVERADLLIATTGFDEVNIVACSIAHQVGQCETICFVSRQDLLPAAGGTDSLRRHFGIGHVVWPEAQLADAIGRIIMVPGALDAHLFADGRIELFEFRIEPSSPLLRGPIASIELPPGVVVAALRRADALSIPRGHFRLTAGDRVVAIGSREGVDRLRQRVLPAADRLLICCTDAAVADVRDAFSPAAR